MEASRPTRLCRWGSTNIKPADSRYDRGTSGGQVKSEAINEAIHLSSLLNPDEVARLFDRQAYRQLVFVDSKAAVLKRTNWDEAAAWPPGQHP